MQTRWRVFKNINAYSYRKGTLETTPFITVRANNDIDASTLELIGVEDFLRAGEPDGWHAATWTQTNHPDGEPITTTQKYVFSKLTAENTLEDNTPPDGDARWALSSLASIHDDYKPDAVRDIVIWSMSDGSFQVGTNTGASTDLIWQKSTKEDISQRMGGKINARGEGLKVDKLWRNGKWHPLTEFVDTTQWTNIRGVDINSSGYILVKADEVGESATKTNVPLLLLPVDIDIIKPGTEDDTSPTEIAEDKEDWDAEKKEGGWVASLNWDDDDNDGGAGGHGNLNFTNDFDDEDGTQNEDDLLQLKVHRIALDNVKGRLKFDAANFRVWKKKDRTEEVKTGDTEFDIKKDEDLILYVEGKKITEAEAPKKIELQIKVANQAEYKDSDAVSLHVATPIILCAGWGPEDPSEETSDIAGVIASGDGIGAKKIDERKSTVVFKGKDQADKLLFYQLDIFDVKPEEELPGKKSKVKIRQIQLDKDMKMALEVEGSHVIYSGHSNYGLGPNFNPQGTQTVDDYMNISNFAVAGIDIAEFNDIKHGGPNFAVRDSDIKDAVSNQQVNIPVGYQEKRFPSESSSFTKKPADNGNPAYHFKQGNDFITIVKSTGDTPTLKYASCFMNSCNSGRHFGMTLDRQVFFYTAASAFSTIDQPKPEVEYNKPTAEVDVIPSVFVSYNYIEHIISGKSWGETASFLDENQHINYGGSKIDNLYRVSE